MNKVILMGRLTRDPEVRYGAERILLQLQDIPLQLSADSKETVSRVQTLLAVLPSGVTQNLQRSICAREQRLY